MRLKNILLVMTFVILLSVISVNAETFQRGDNIDLKLQVDFNGVKVASTTKCNVTVLDSDNIALVTEQAMSYNPSSIFNYTLTNTTDIGDYSAVYYCQSPSSSGFYTDTFTISASGENVTTGKGVLYIGLTGLLIFLFLITIVGIFKIPSKNETDDYGNIMSISKLKYIVPVLFASAWGLLLSIVFTGSRIASIYIGDTGLGNILLGIFRVMVGLTVPMIVIWFIYIFVSIFRDRQVKNMLERGIDFRDI